MNLEERVLEMVKQQTAGLNQRLLELEQLCNGDDLPDDEAAPELDIEHVVIPFVRKTGFWGSDEKGNRDFANAQMTALRKLEAVLNRPGAFVVDSGGLDYDEATGRVVIVAYYRLAESSVRPINDVQLHEADIEDATVRLAQAGAS